MTVQFVHTSMTSSPAPTSVQRQIVLPLSKAVEIAYKNIRLRLSRSMLVISGIVLALAFLMSILTSDALTDSMRAWSRSPAPRRRRGARAGRCNCWPTRW